LGRWGSAAISVLLTWIILSFLGRVEFWTKKRQAEAVPIEPETKAE
jgi:hypothetical protein